MNGEYAFSFIGSIRDLSFEEGLVRIRAKAFVRCCGFRIAAFPTSLEVIENQEFWAAVHSTVSPSLSGHVCGASVRAHFVNARLMALSFLGASAKSIPLLLSTTSGPMFEELLCFDKMAFCLQQIHAFYYILFQRVAAS
jgi:hypothetical protein